MEKSIANLILNQLIYSFESPINPEKIPSSYYDRLDMYKNIGIEFNEKLKRLIYLCRYEIYGWTIDAFFSDLISLDFPEEDLNEFIADSELPFESELGYEDYKRLKHYNSMGYLLDCYGEKEVRLEFDFDFFEDEEDEIKEDYGWGYFTKTLDQLNREHKKYVEKLDYEDYYFLYVELPQMSEESQRLYGLEFFEEDINDQEDEGYIISKIEELKDEFGECSDYCVYELDKKICSNKQHQIRDEKISLLEFELWWERERKTSHWRRYEDYEWILLQEAAIEDFENFDFFEDELNELKFNIDFDHQ